MSATQRFIRSLFGDLGTRTAIPDLTTGDGSLSYQQGYGPDYQRQKTDPLAKNIERDKMNQLFYDFSLNQRQYQLNGAPEFIPAADNGGVPVSYAANARVLYTDGYVYVSLVAANVALPTDNTKWRRASVEDMSGLRGLQVYAATQVLTAADTNKQLIFGGTTYSVTLPAANAVPPGTMLRARSNATGNVTIGRAGADTLQAANGNNALTSLPLGPGDSLQLVSDGVSGWLVVGGSAQLQFAKAFGASLGAAGFQQLPSGVIWQWQVVNVTVSSTQVFTLPTSFLSAYYGVGSSVYGTGMAAGNNAAVGAVPNGLSQTSVQNLYSASTLSVQLNAIGK